jgi:hypothetical protein
MIITTANQSRQFREIIAAYSENYVKLADTLCGQNLELLTAKADGT